jgi:phenylalanyl-tRNA synthetase alpha subunit
MMQEEIIKIQDEINAFIISNELELDKFRIDFVGRKGRLASLFDQLKNVPAEERREVGQTLNGLKNLAESKFAEAQQLYEQAVSTYTHGFQGAYLLQKPGTDEGIAVIMWSKIEDMEENQTEAYEKILEEMKHLFVKPPVACFYEVSTEIEGKKLTN